MLKGRVQPVPQRTTGQSVLQEAKQGEWTA